MLSPDDVEALSRMLAGELPAPEEAVLRAQLLKRPELQQALERLRALDAATAQLSVTEADDQVAQQAAQAAARRAGGFSFKALVGAAALAAAVAALGVWFGRATPAEVAPVVPIAAKRQLAPGELLESKAGPEAVELKRGSMTLVGHAWLSREPTGERYRLVKGSVVIDGQTEVFVGEAKVSLDGRVIITTEPEEALAHVTSPTAGLGPLQPGDVMTDRIAAWEKTRPMWLTGALMAVFVVEGTAQASLPGEPVVKLAAGQVWTPAVSQSSSTPPVAEGFHYLRATPEASTLAEAGPPPRPQEMLPLAMVNEAVLPQSQAIGRCFEQALKGNPTLAGKLTLLLTLRTEGDHSVLHEGSVAGDYSLQNPFVASCVLEQMNKVRYPKPKWASEVQLAYPLEFKPRGEGQVGAMVLLPQIDDEPRHTVMPDRQERLAIEVGDSPSTGPANAKVTVVEFSSAECTFCVKHQATMLKLRRQYAGRVNFVFKHHPLGNEIGGRRAAEAMVAAEQQRRFWEFHDALFVANAPLDDAGLVRTAQRLGLDVSSFDATRKGSASGRVDLDLALAERLGSKGIPSTFINGRELMGSLPYERLRDVIEEELRAPPAKAGGLQPQTQSQALAGRAPIAVTDRQQRVSIELGVSPTTGPANAKVTVVEFSSTGLSFTSANQATMLQLRREYAGRVNFVYKHHPLLQGGSATRAADAMVAAQRQGRFWEFHDAVYLLSGPIEDDALLRVAERVGLDVQAFDAARKGTAHRQVEADVAQAELLEAENLPTTFVNGRELVGSQSIDRFRQVIDEELRAAPAPRK